MRRLFLIPLMLSAIYFIGCSSKSTFSPVDSETTYRKLERDYNRGRYLDAKDGLNFFTLNYSGSALVDSAQFLLGWTHYHLKEYLLAANAFDELSRRFPSSNLVPEAMYLVGECFWKMSPKYSLDQEYTRETIRNMQNFIEYFPDYRDKVVQAQAIISQARDKLARKSYENGVIYMKMKDYTAAIIYFQSVMDDYYDTEWAGSAAYQIAVSFSLDKQTSQAQDAYRLFMQKYPNHPWLDRAQHELEDLGVKS